MRSLSGQTDIFGLDLGVTAVRMVELKGASPTKALNRYAWAPFEANEAISDAESDMAKVINVITKLLQETGITNRKAAVNLPSNRVFTTVIDMDKLPTEEMAKTIQFQAGSFIPTPIEKSKIDWAVIGDSPKDPNKVEVLLSSVPNEYVISRLQLLEKAGIDVVAFEPDGMALARALIANDSMAPQMVLDMGKVNTDLVVVINGVPHLTRSIAIGDQAVVQAAMQTLKIDQKQAEQFVFKFGLGQDKLEGQVYSAIIGIVDSLVSEVEKSIKFFQGRYPNQKLERIIVTGGASAMPELPLYIANKFGMNVEIGNAWRNVSVPGSRQNEVAAVSNHFGVAVGLAEREV